MRLLLVAVFLAFLTPTAKADTGSPYDNIDPVRASKIKHHTAKAKTTRPSVTASTSLNGVVYPLAAKTREIVAACGSRVISSVRHTRIAGSRHMSLHASGQAVDLQGNPSCIYRHLAGWPGGYSVDYHRVQHVHISYGGREAGLRFNHYGAKKRHAKRHRHRFARAG